MSSIVPHPKGFRAHVYVGGRRASRVFGNWRDADLWAKRKTDELAAGVGQHTFGQAVAKYATSVTAKKDGAVWERRRLAAMVQQLGADTLLTDITTPVLAAWRDDRLRTVSGSTVVREVNILRNLLNVARLEWHWIQHKPFDGLKLPRENQPRKAVWTWPLIKRVLRAPRAGKTAEVQAAFHIALRTGMRLQEVLAAPPLFDKARRVVTLAKTKTGTGQSVPIGRIAARLLLRPAFTVSANEASTLFSRLCKELLIDGLTFHDARATALTLLSKKVDVLTLAKISRHKDLSLLLNTYYRATADEIARKI